MDRKSETYYSAARPEILAALPAAPGRALDVGCAAGFLGEALKKRGASHVAGIELVPEVAREAEKRLDEVFTGDVETLELPFEPDSFDTIICADVLEHLRDPWAALKKLAAFLKPDTGLLAVCVPNVAHYSVIVSLLAGNWRYEEMGILDATHLRYFTADGARELVAGAGLALEKILPLVLPPDSGLSDRSNPDYLKKDVLKFVSRFIGEDQAAAAKKINVNQYFVYEYLLLARKPGRDRV